MSVLWDWLILASPQVWSAWQVSLRRELEPGLASEGSRGARCLLLMAGNGSQLGSPGVCHEVCRTGK